MKKTICLVVDLAIMNRTIGSADYYGKNWKEDPSESMMKAA